MENFSLFDEQPEKQETLSPPTAPLDIVKTEFIESQKMSWQDLFSGFDTIHAITYSSGIEFAYKLLSMFQQAEIIFGCEEIMSYTLQEVMAYQSKTLEQMRDTASKMKLDLVSRIDQGTLRFFVAHTVLSHEKIYLLSSADGQKRVIAGSANMSYSAFGGHQRENIVYMDGEDAYDWYWGCYCQMRDESTDQISKEAFLCSSVEDIKKLPIAETVRVKKAMVLEPVQEASKKILFGLDVKNLAEKYASSVPKPDKKGKIIIVPDTIRTIQRKLIPNFKKEEEQQRELPQMEVHPNEMYVSLNGEILNLDPAPEEIQHDILLFLKYMDGYKNFHGDTANLQQRYYEFANWIFCSPFMAQLRYIAKQYGFSEDAYPVFGLIYGQSKAGKTSFLETLLKMMVGQKFKMTSPEFTRTNIDKLKHAVKGVPIIVDDLTNKRFNDHAVESIKNSEFGITEKLLYYPVVVISANEDVKAVGSEITRRTIICHVRAGLTNAEILLNSTVRNIQSEIGTALYREYLKRMLKVVSSLMDEMSNNLTNESPDIFEKSSQILLDIFKEYSDENLPDYVNLLTAKNYFDEKVTGQRAIRIIQNAWKTSRDSFQIFEETNELCYDAGDNHEANQLMKELPATLNTQKSNTKLIMDLQEARKYFGLPFKKTLFERFKKKRN